MRKRCPNCGWVKPLPAKNKKGWLLRIDELTRAWLDRIEMAPDNHIHFKKEFLLYWTEHTAPVLRACSFAISARHFAYYLRTGAFPKKRTVVRPDCGDPYCVSPFHLADKEGHVE